MRVRPVRDSSRVEAGGSVHTQDLSAYEACLDADQESYGIRDIYSRGITTQRGAFLHHGCVGLTRGEKAGCSNRTRTDTVDAQAGFAHLCSETTCVVDNGGFCARIDHFRVIAV